MAGLLRRGFFLPIVIVAGCLALISFQNCSGTSFAGSSEAVAAKGGNTNGGFDGKLFEERGICEGVPESVITRVWVSHPEPRVAYFEIENCIKYPMQSLASHAERIASVSFDTHIMVLTDAKRLVEIDQTTDLPFSPGVGANLANDDGYACHIFKDPGGSDEAFTVKFNASGDPISMIRKNDINIYSLTPSWTQDRTYEATTRDPIGDIVFHFHLNIIDTTSAQYANTPYSISGEVGFDTRYFSCP